jgi:uncharacterized protein (DUF362 family)
MKRREFLLKGLGAGMLTGTALTLGDIENVFAGEPSSLNAQNFNANYDLVAVKNGEPDVMLDKALEALGGISTFVKKGQKVVVKPNIGWDAVPERAANTNPKLIARLVKHCMDAGAKEVVVFDNTCDEWTRCYKNSGIESAAKNAGASVVPGNAEKYYQNVSIPNGKKLKSAKVHEKILEADVFINVPVLKSHGGAQLTIAMKNLMGIVWDRGYWHKNDLHQCIADFTTYSKPTLNIIDAYRIMKTNGPRGVSVDDTVIMKSLLASTNIVAVDAAASKLFYPSGNPSDIGYLNNASTMGIGNINLSKLNIKRISL